MTFTMIDDAAILGLTDVVEDKLPDFAATSRAGDKEPIRCQEPGCSNEVIKPARGRTPRFCPEHKRATTAKGSSRSSWPRSAEIEKLLNTYILGIGGGLTLTKYKADGDVIIMHGSAVVHEVVELAKSDKKLRHVLELLATPGRYGPLALAVMPLIFGIMANHKLLPQFVVNLTGTPSEEG